MANIVIKNFGPILDLELETNKVNVIMGGPHSGKNLLLRTICYFQWLEKHLSLRSDYNGYDQDDKLMKEFIEYHHLTPNNFRKNTEIRYIGRSIYIHFKENSVQINRIKPKEEVRNYKMAYIPSVRNLVALFPNMMKEITRNTAFSDFYREWIDSGKNLDNIKIDIPGLESSYLYDETNNKEYITYQDETIELEYSSNDFRSLVPLITIVNNLGYYLYDKTQFRLSLLEKLTRVVQEEQNRQSEVSTKIASSLSDLKNRFKYQFTRFFIEEPEQNLHPTVQRDVMKYLLALIDKTEIDHHLTFTTQSPFVLYTLNNCMLEYLTEKNPEEKLYTINPQKVSVFELDKGVVKRVQEESGAMSKNSIDKCVVDMKEEIESQMEKYNRYY